jgi:hypothetical protein
VLEVYDADNDLVLALLYGQVSAVRISLEGLLTDPRDGNCILGVGHSLPTFVAAAGDPNVTEKLLKGYKVGAKTYKVHLDGYDLLPFLTGETDKSPRESFFYFSDDGDLLAMRVDNWKITFMEQKCSELMELWANPFTVLRVPRIYNLRTDPFEFAITTSNTYYDWLLDHVYLLVPAQRLVGQFLGTFKDYPPRQKAASFSLGQVLEKLQAQMGSH